LIGALEIRMSASKAAPMADDVSALAWVHGELRRSLENAHKALRRHLKESDSLGSSDVDSVDPAILRGARMQIHQGVGALELVGLPTVANVLRASEAAVQRMMGRPGIVDAAAVEAVEKASFAVLDFLGRQLAGKPLSPVALFPQYRAAQQLAGADRVHPADLWPHDFQWHELPAEPGVAPRPSDDAAREQLEAGALALMRGADPSALRAMSQFAAELGAGAQRRQEATLWQLAAAVFEAQAEGLLAPDVYTKRLASRLLAQLRLAVRGQHEASDRLAHDLLFFCAHARLPDAPAAAPRLAAVRRLWQLDLNPSAEYDTPRLGRFDPAVVALARKRVAGAKEAWSAVAGGELHRLGSLTEQFSLVGDSLTRLFPSGDVLAQALQSAAAQTVGSGQAPSAPLAMEVATGILYLDASIEDGELDHPELANRIRRLAGRIDDVRVGGATAPLEPWMEELYRRVSDRQTMGSVVQELRAQLSEVEKQIDQYFRNPAERQLLIPVPGQLQAMRGVLSVLGLDQASQAVLHMRDDVDALASTEVDPQQAIAAGSFDRVADNLGALSFLIDMLSVQPALAKSLFRFDPATGQLSAVMGQSERTSVYGELAPLPSTQASASATTPTPVLSLPEQARALAEAAQRPTAPDAEIERGLERLAAQAQAAEQTALARTASASLAALRAAASDSQRHTVRLDLARALGTLAAPPTAAAPPPPAAPPKTTPAAPQGGTGLEDDAEMREIFLEEAREVVTEAREALERLADAPESTGDLTAVRRAFHTLKGSSRMVGLRDFGEAAWACEQLYNARLASAPRLDAPLRQFTAEALDYLAAWTEAIAGSVNAGHHSQPVVHAAETLRLQGARVPIEAAQPPAAAASVEAAAPAASMLPVPPVPALELPATPAAEVAAPVEPVTLPSLPVLELALDAEPAAPPAPPAAAEPFAETITAFEPVRAPEAPPGETESTLPILSLTDVAEAGTPPPPAATPVDRLDFDFELDLDGGDSPDTQVQSDVRPTERSARPSELQSLVTRVPDLPSAADLDLGPAAAPLAAPPAAPRDAALGAEVPAFELDLRAFDETAEAVPAARPEPAADEAASDDDQVKVVGPLRISIPLFNIFLNEADEQSRRLAVELAEWGVDALAHPVPDSSVALAHSLAGNSATVGYADLSSLARALEHALERAQAVGRGRAGEAELFGDAADEIRRLLHQFAAGFLRPVPEALMARLADHERWPAESGEAADAAESSDDDGRDTPTVTDLRPAANEAFVDPPVPAGAGQAAEVPAEALVEASVDASLDAPVDAPVEAPVEAIELPEIVDLDLAVGTPFGPAEPAVPVAPHAEPAAEPEPEAVAARAPLQPVSVSAFAPLAELPEVAPHARADAFDDDADIDAVDAVDAELFPIFDEEAAELLPQLQSELRQWHARPSDRGAAAACMRTLHTFKGGARLAGAMRLGEMAHRLETAVEHLLARDAADAADVEPLLARGDAMAVAFEALRRGPAAEAGRAPTEAAAEPAIDVLIEPVPAVPASSEAEPPAVAQAPVAAPAEPPEPAAPLAASSPLPAAGAPVAPAAGRQAAAAQPAAVVDWARFAQESSGVVEPAERAAAGVAAAAAAVRVRAGLLDRLVNQAGEVSIARERIAADTKALQGALNDLTESLERLRRQLRDIELHSETQIASRLESARAAGASFDPLEMDRFTRFQELTRFMAESVNDVATLQRGLQRTLQSTEDELAVQARVTRELQDDLLRTRMVEFESLADRLYRTVRQAAKETGKQVRLDIGGGAIEVDRGVLERMVGPFEHLLRNSVVHGIEPAEVRTAAGKDAGGRILVQVAQSGNEVQVEIGDDGGGFDYERIRRRGLERGLITPEAAAAASEAELAQLLFVPGFSTAENVTELAGRGVGLDVVRAEVNAMGGRIETASAPGKGTRFRLLLPLTTAVTQVVMLRCDTVTVAVPSTLIEVVRRVPTADVEAAYASGEIEHGGERVPFFWLAALLQAGTRGGGSGRSQTVVIVRSATQRVAVHIDEVVGNQEVVVKNVGPQLARLPGLAGVTLLPSGAVALIYNPVALATLYADSARERMRQRATAAAAAAAAGTPSAAAAAPERRAPLVLVVDDSLTVRRVTQRLLAREGYRVVLAKDGLEALERLAEERPTVLLSDIEMPRMDGFDLVRNVRADARLADLPVVMITSRIAQKHRDYAAELGVDHYLGKPYSEDELLALVARYAGREVSVS
jgi:chemosensory pili system protein ChpA (sensor histidine kinase/response regulator)